MSETNPKTLADDDARTPAVAPEPGPVSQWLQKQGFDHDVLDPTTSVSSRSVLMLLCCRSLLRH